MKKKQNYIYKNFLLAIKELKELKNYIIFSLVVFALFTVIGLIYPTLFQEQILELIKSLILQTQNLRPLELISFIMANNLRVAFFGMLLGIVFGIIPTLALIVNGYVLGFVLHRSVLDQGILIIWRLLPHGIFEIPAILISTALGIKLGINLRHIKPNFKSAVRIFLLIVVPLLVIAGIIEGLLIAFIS